MCPSAHGFANQSFFDAVDRRRRVQQLSWPGIGHRDLGAVAGRKTSGSPRCRRQGQLQINGEKVLCVEKKVVRMYPISCRSESGLEVSFVPYLLSAKDHDQTFYSLLQQLQKF
jgi:hypothetical protein